MNKVHIDLNGCSEEMDYDLPDVAPVKGDDTTDSNGNRYSNDVDVDSNARGIGLDVDSNGNRYSNVKGDDTTDSNGNRYSNDVDVDSNARGIGGAGLDVDSNGNRWSYKRDDEWCVADSDNNLGVILNMEGSL
eukprot:88988_1